MNTPVKSKVAKLLKEKGFGVDEEHQNYYIKEGYYNEEGDLIECDEQSGSLSLFEEKYSAPTIAEVVMWLYEKHGIWIFADYGKKTKGWYHNIQTLATSNHTERILWESGYNSPTEAYEAAIEYVLNNLIN